MSPRTTQNAIKGHSICFEHDSPKVCSNLLSPDTIKEDIVIQFVGPDGEYDKLLNKVKTMKPSHLHARAHVIYQWLAALKKIKNPLYKDEPKLPDLESLRDSLKTTIDSLINESINTFDSNALERTEVKKDDIAGIRASSVPNHELSDL